MPDDAAARERIERRGIPLALRAPALRAVASAWLGGFVGLLLPPWLRRLFHRPMPVCWQRVTFYVARRTVVGVALFARRIGSSVAGPASRGRPTRTGLADHRGQTWLI